MRRRTELLGALAQLIAERPVDEIEIADVTQRAGVARSLFYFYFPGKASAIAALLADVLDDVTGAAASWCTGGGAPARELLEPGITAIVEVWRAHAREILALLEAVRGDARAHAQWIQWGTDCAAHIRARIERDQADGLVRAGLNPGAIAQALVGMMLAEMERDVRALIQDGAPLPGLVDALVHIWEQAIYG
ncbi:MAG TPA: TetR/AcrR family transcriptional regulator, partial [Solirubrobacteraceae bacterium]|nr:TetR/AcrR family transcriptional regulator [Solirubrobacteraceae bacterium]